VKELQPTFVTHILHGYENLDEMIAVFSCTISMEILNDPRMADGEDGELKEKLSGRRRT
jgi:carotenoid cleavage dioxygenase-like enzyme